MMRKGGIERSSKSIGIGFFEFHIFDEVLERRQHNLGSKRKRSRHSPWGKSPIIRSVRNATGDVVEKLNFTATHGGGRRTGTIAGGEAPAKTAVSLKAARIADAIFALYECGAPAVLEVIHLLVPHEGVLYAAEIDPDMRKLVSEQRARVEIFIGVDFPPFVAGRPG